MWRFYRYYPTTAVLTKAAYYKLYYNVKGIQIDIYTRVHKVLLSHLAVTVTLDLVFEVYLNLGHLWSSTR